MLGDRMLQHVIVCNPDDSLILRIGYWLDQKLLYLLRWPNPKDPGKNEFKELLKKLIKLTQFTKVNSSLSMYIPYINYKSRLNFLSLKTFFENI
jgi:hypothetical protein